MKPAALFLLAALCAQAGAPCAKLVDLTIPDVAVRQAAPAPEAACRIQASVRTSPDSEVDFELWMPAAAAWNGKLEMFGNGGYSGALPLAQMGAAVKRGFAAVGHNTGHAGDQMRFGQGHPERIVDFAHRATHVALENSRIIVRVHLGRLPSHAYFIGCSTGGNQALQAAQKYPADFDGIVAGAPANDRLGQTFAFNAAWRALRRDDGSLLLARDKLPLINKAVMDACDALDGVKDGIIADPRPCPEPDLAGLLTAEELAAVRKVWAGTTNPRTGARIFAGWSMGSEDLGGQSWATYLLNPPEPMRSDLFRFFLFNDPNWDYRTLDLDRDHAYALRKLGYMNATGRDMSAFRKNGGKLLMYAGWADPVVPPADTVGYFDAVTKTMGDTRDFLRLFMVPGMGHCGGGPGAYQFDPAAALDAWVTTGAAPDRLTARNPGRNLSRPLCAYPASARYKASGSVDDASNWHCVQP